MWLMLQMWQGAFFSSHLTCMFKTHTWPCVWLPEPLSTTDYKVSSPRRQWKLIISGKHGKAKVTVGETKMYNWTCSGSLFTPAIIHSVRKTEQPPKSPRAQTQSEADGKWQFLGVSRCSSVHSHVCTSGGAAHLHELFVIPSFCS